MTNRKLHNFYALSIGTKIDDLWLPWSGLRPRYSMMSGRHGRCWQTIYNGIT